MSDLALPSTSELLQAAWQASRGEPAGDSDERWKLVVELHRRGEPVVFRAASTWCESAKVCERRLGADLLGQLGYCKGFPFRDTSLPLLEGLLGDGHPEVVQSALYALSHLGPRGSVARILPLAGHESPQVRHAVAFALVGQVAAGVVATLVELSRDSHDDVRSWATFALGWLSEVDSPEVDGDGVGEALFERLGDPHAETRCEALVGLARRHDPRVLEPLLAELTAEEVGALAVEAAYEIASPTLLPALQELESWWDVDPRLLAEAIERSQTP